MVTDLEAAQVNFQVLTGRRIQYAICNTDTVLPIFIVVTAALILFGASWHDYE